MPEEEIVKPPDDKALAPLAGLFNSMLEKREEGLLAGLSKQIALLGATPVRDEAAEIHPDGPVERERTIVSRHQPTDPLYRTLHKQTPQYAEVRTPDQDHWNATWLRAFIANDIPTMRMAEAKGDEAGGYRPRATTLGGGLSTEVTALPTGTGQHLLPQSYAQLVDIARGAAAVIAPLCTNFTTDGLTLRVPTVGAVTADTIAEGASGAGEEPTFASEMLILHKIGARMIASDEMVADSAFNLMEVYGRRAGEGIGTAEDLQICTTGGTAPDLTEAIAGGNVNEATSTVLVFEDLNTIFFSLGKAYQPNSTWLGGTLVCTLLSNMLDTNGAPILRVPAQAPGPVTDVSSPNAIGTVLGRPIYHVPLASGQLILGDIRGYGFVRRPGIEAKMSTDVGFATDTVQFKFTERVDGRIIDDVAMKQVADIATVA